MTHPKKRTKLSKPSFCFEKEKNVGVYFVEDKTYKPSKLQNFLNWILRKPKPTIMKVSE